MLVFVLSPAKTLDLNLSSIAKNLKWTVPKFVNEANTLASELQKLKVSDLKSLYGVSDNIAKINYERWQNFLHPNEATYPAALTFNGPAFQGLQAESFSDSEWKYAQDRLCILCGLYGILRPLDEIKPYRLEMGQKMSIGNKKTSLYEYWDTKISQELIQRFDNLSTETKNSSSNILINVASEEYFKSIHKETLSSRGITIIQCIFKDDGKIKSVYAKKARGLMCQWLIRNSIDSIEDLKKFHLEGYAFSDKESDDSTRFVFHRTGGGKRKRNT